MSAIGWRAVAAPASAGDCEPSAVGLRWAALAVAMLLAGCGDVVSPLPPTTQGPALAMPAISPGTGTYSATQMVSISEATPGAAIYYTTNGTAPTAASNVYTGAIAVSANETIQAIAACGGYSNSPVATATYTFAALPPAATPTFTPAPGTYTAAQSVTLSDATPGAQIYYTTNGTTPTTASSAYGGAISVASSVTIEAIAVAPGYSSSPVATGAYTINTGTLAEWTWMGGSSLVHAAGNWGTLGVAAAANVPSARDSGMSWKDGAGNLWLFGGETYIPIPGTIGTSGYYNDLWRYNLASAQWTWMGGTNNFGAVGTAGAPGVYGTKGTPSTSNIPGARLGGVTWTDTAGNLWLFGGFNPNIYAVGGLVDWWFNDLWQYNPATGTWTWVSGSSSPNANGVYGTLGVAAAGNVPGARFGAVSWTDSAGNFWLFGGEGLDATNSAAGSVRMLNDLWMFNPSTKQWTWMSGNSTGNQDSVYGTLGTAAAGNVPGGRYGAYSWTDAAGNLWLFGGEGINNALPSGTNWYNDLWRFNPLTRQWTWMSGSSTFSSPGVYGALGVAAATNVPGARYFGANWTDAGGNLWLYGGAGFDSRGNFQWVDDLWQFNPATNLWTWMDGGSGNNELGIYGSLGVSSVANVPGARFGPVEWTDVSGNLWMFGGVAFDANGTQGEINDLWRYQP